MSHAGFPEGYALCPKCQGTCRIPVPPEQEAYKKLYSEYDPVTETLKCDNCGGQTMMQTPKGYTTKRTGSDEGCLHKYDGHKRGNCYYVYNCMHCPFTFDIDSGD